MGMGTGGAMHLNTWLCFHLNLQTLVSQSLPQRESEELGML